MKLGKQVTMIDVGDWDELVEKTYGRPYSFQQQDGCKQRGTHEFSVPYRGSYDYENDTVPEKINHSDMGVSFAAWLARDPKQQLALEPGREDQWGINLWWHRNFYPSVDMIINDLHKKGLLPEGDYVIDIDW